MNEDLVCQRIKEAEIGSQEKEVTYCSFSNKLKNSLSNILDADYGLLQKLYGNLTDRQYHPLSQCNGYDRNDKLMEIVQLLPRDDFLNALSKTGQQHIVNFIEHEENDKVVDANETCWPLTEKQRSILRHNLHELSNMIDIDSLLMELYPSNSITDVHLNYIRATEVTYDRSVRLLTIMLKRSQADYHNFVSALIKIGQGHLANILSEGGAVAAVRAVLADVNLEDEMVAMFKQWSRLVSREERQRKLIELLGPGLELSDIGKSRSVAVYFLCETLSAFQRLDEMLKDGRLKSAVGEIFSTILDGRHVEIKEFDFYESSYNACLHFFYKSMDCYHKFAVCDPHDVTDVMEQQKSSLSPIDLPLELLEIVLVKGVVLVFKNWMTLTSTDADSLAITAVWMVCRVWRHVLKNRSFIRQQIKETLDRLCYPIRRRIDSCSESLLVTNKDGSKSSVRGAATLNHHLFVVSGDSPTVRVFDLTSFTPQRDIRLEGFLNSSQDIATCEVTRRIYIADWEHRCVWRIDWSSSSPRSCAGVTDESSSAVKFIDCDYKPWKLSTSGRRQQLLVMGFKNSLYVYDVDGKLARRVELSTEVDDEVFEWSYPRHVVQTTTGDNFLACRTGRHKQQPLYTHVEVAEYNSTGQRIRYYYSGAQGDGPHQVNFPVYMSLVGDGRLLVVDSWASRVLLFNAALKLERVLLTSQQLNVDDPDKDCNRRPERICYNSQTGTLCVIMNNRRVSVFKI